jgi:predicted nucleic acid-binding protein
MEARKIALREGLLVSGSVGVLVRLVQRFLFD